MMFVTDQAGTLRNMASQMFLEKKGLGEENMSAEMKQGYEAETMDGVSPVQVIAVGGGKGGVGKTNIAANMAIAFAQAGGRVLAVDADLGMANLDLAFGVRPKASFWDLFQGTASIDEVLTEVSDKVHLLPGCSGRYELANMSDEQRYSLFSAIDTVEERFDTLILDIGAGIGANAIHFAGAAQKVVVVTSPEPTALADAYGFIKVLHSECAIKQVFLVANMVNSPAEGEEVYMKLASMLDRFLGVSLYYLGAVNRDNAVGRSVRTGVPFLVGKPEAAASQCIVSISRRLAEADGDDTGAGGIRLFWKKLIGWKDS
jgi:flagellar biosynthesis protein FlhG